MCKLFIKRTLFLLVALLAVSVLVGCGEDDMDEPDITVDYLTEDYSQQLKADGAEVFVGSVDMIQDGEGYAVRITEKKIVKSDKEKKGYYLAETNNIYERALGQDSRIVYFDGKEPVIGTADDFINEYNDHPSRIYEAYCFSDTCELILPINPKTYVEK